MKITNTIKTQITLPGVVIPASGSVDVDPAKWARLKQDARVWGLIERGTLTEPKAPRPEPQAEPEPEQETPKRHRYRSK